MLSKINLLAWSSTLSFFSNKWVVLEGQGHCQLSANGGILAIKPICLAKVLLLWCVYPILPICLQSHPHNQNTVLSSLTVAWILTRNVWCSLCEEPLLCTHRKRGVPSMLGQTMTKWRKSRAGCIFLLWHPNDQSVLVSEVLNHKLCPWPKGEFYFPSVATNL